MTLTKRNSVKLGTVIAVLAAACLGAATRLCAEIPKPADAVAEAIGVNTHFGFSTTQYFTQTDAVISLMQKLGVRYYRDGLLYL